MGSEGDGAHGAGARRAEPLETTGAETLRGADWERERRTPDLGARGSEVENPPPPSQQLQDRRAGPRARSGAFFYAFPATHENDGHIAIGAADPPLDPADPNSRLASRYSRDTQSSAHLDLPTLHSPSLATSGCLAQPFYDPISLDHGTRFNPTPVLWAPLRAPETSPSLEQHFFGCNSVGFDALNSLTGDPQALEGPGSYSDHGMGLPSALLEDDDLGATGPSYDIPDFHPFDVYGPPLAPMDIEWAHVPSYSPA